MRVTVNIDLLWIAVKSKYPPSNMHVLIYGEQMWVHSAGISYAHWDSKGEQWIGSFNGEPISKEDVDFWTELMLPHKYTGDF